MRALATRLGAGLAVLAAAIVAWAALPMAGASAGARPVLLVAVVAAALTIAQLASRIRAARPAGGPETEGAPGQPERYVPPAVESARRTWSAIAAVPWPQLMIVTVLVLEALHPASPWHTVALGLVLLAFLFGLHLAETGDPPSVLRGQLPLIAAGAGLAVLSAAAGLLPAAGSGWLTGLAAVAALIVAGLALPV